MTDDEVMALIKGDSPLNKARQIFSSYSAMIEQDQMQRRPSGPIEILRMQFEAVQRIREIFEKD